MYSTKNILKKKFFWVTLIYTYEHTYTQTHTFIYTFSNTYTHALTYSNTTYMYIYTYTHTHTRKHTQTKHRRIHSNKDTALNNVLTCTHLLLIVLNRNPPHLKS